VLDPVRPSERQIQEAAAAIEAAGSERPTLVCCALGVERSAAAVAAWLVSSGRASNLSAASGIIRERRPNVKLTCESSAPLASGLTR
jgi:protein-tyrosine phosphatase